jgi:hypothetical protein
LSEFISLREFLLFTEDYGGHRSIHRNSMLDQSLYSHAQDLVLRYDIAKASFEKYGESPPLGSKVETLYPGFGGGPGCVRTLKGVFEDDPRFFLLTNESKDYWGESKDEHYLLDRDHWWALVRVVEET